MFNSGPDPNKKRANPNGPGLKQRDQAQMDLPRKKKRRENKNLIPKWAFSKKKNINFDLLMGLVGHLLINYFVIVLIFVL